MLRKLGTTEHAMTTTFYTLLLGWAITAPHTILYGPSPASILAITSLCGLASATILIAKTQAFRYAEASILSPVQYTMIIWAALAGWSYGVIYHQPMLSLGPVLLLRRI